MDYKIITEDSVLRQKSQDTSIKEVEDLLLIGHLKTAIKTAWREGVGLAAIQIGVPLRVSWYSIPPKRQDAVMINPIIIELNDYRPFQGEGCLSIPGRRFNTGRYNEVTVEGTFIIGETVHENTTVSAHGLEAAVLQHEIDHFDGILCKDKVREYRKIKEPGRNEPCHCGSGRKYKKCCLP